MLYTVQIIYLKVTDCVFIKINIFYIVSVIVFQMSRSLRQPPATTACPATAATRRGTSFWQPSPGSPTFAPVVCVWMESSAVSQSPALRLTVLGLSCARASAAPIA